ATLDPSELDDELLCAVWRALGRLEALGIAHRQIEPETVAVVSERVGFVEFGTATVQPTSQEVATDRAHLLVSTAGLVGSGRAIGAAVDVPGADEPAALLPYLQAAALGDSLRTALEPRAIDVDELRAQTAAAVGTEPPELARLRRVSARAL